MYRKCKQCRKRLELVKSNFRISRGYFAYTCRVCRNANKRKKYKKQKTQAKSADPKKTARQQRVKALVKKYERIYKILDAHGVSPNAPADVVDRLLQACADRRRKTA